MNPVAPDLGSLLAPDRCAVVTMEIQRGVVGDLSPFPQLVAAADEAGVVPRTARILGAARALDVPVIHCTAAFRADRAGSTVNCRLIAAMVRRPDHLLEGTPAADLVDELGPEAGDLVCARLHGVSPFSGTSLDAWLRSFGVATVIATGVSLTSSPGLKPGDSWRTERSDRITGAPEPGGSGLGLPLEVFSSPEVLATGCPDAFTRAARPEPEACPMPSGVCGAETPDALSIVGASPRTRSTPGLKPGACARCSVNLGVLGLAIEAVNLGYQVVVPRDAVAGTPTRYADAVLENTFPLIATLTTTDAVIDAWR